MSGSTYAANDPKPILYGQLFDGVTPADGSTVTVYPQSNQADSISDTVGVTGNTALSSYWKTNLGNLDGSVSDNDVIVISATDGDRETTRTYTTDLNDGAVFFLLNLDPAYQDYDGDGIFGDTDCDDNDAEAGGPTEEICGDGIDQDCNGSDLSCDSSSQINLFQGWTSFALPINPAGIGNSEELGQAIIDSGINCDVMMKFNGDTQLWQDDLLGLDDPSFSLAGGIGYFIHCYEEGVFNYQGTAWA